MSVSAIKLQRGVCSVFFIVCLYYEVTAVQRASWLRKEYKKYCGAELLVVVFSRGRVVMFLYFRIQAC